MLTEKARAQLGMLLCCSTVQQASQWSPPPRDLASLVPGEVVEEAGGSFYRIRQPVSLGMDRDPDGDSPCRPEAGDAAEHPDLQSFGSAFPSRVLYMDLETCGFSGASLFLIGLLRFLDGRPVVEQLLARDYSEEAAVLTHFWKLLPVYEVLVTFNGKAFDWPFVRDRSTALRLVPATGVNGYRTSRRNGRSKSDTDSIPRAHLDVLHFARRLWKKEFQLPNCRLQTLESVLCRRRRCGDIPGHMIGEVYHSFIRSGDARRLQQVLQHNLVDLLTLAQLSLFLIPQSGSISSVG